MSEIVSTIEGVFADPEKVFEDRIGIGRDRLIYRGVGIVPHAEAYRGCKTSRFFSGFIDMHTHLRQCDQLIPESEDYVSGQDAALHGGVTSIGVMGNTVIPINTEYLVKFNYEMAERMGRCRVKIIPALTVDMIENRKNLRSLLGMPEVDVVKFYTCETTGGVYIPEDKTAAMFRAIAEESGGKKPVVIVHCENQRMNDRAAHDLRSQWYPSKHCDDRPPESEVFEIDRIAKEAADYDIDLHVAHVSTEAGLGVVREHMARRPGRVSAEVAQHHWNFDRGAMHTHGAYAKMNPPLRGRSDMEYLRRELLHGGMPLMAVTDHAPHTSKAKFGEKPPSGVTGLDHFGAAIAHALHDDPDINLTRVAWVTSYRAALRFNLMQRGRIAQGYFADIVEIDPENPMRVSKLHTKCGHTIYPMGDGGWPEVRRVWVSGREVFRDGERVISDEWL
jgi:dihydroorotase